MILGFVSAILAEDNFEQVIDIAARLGYGCVELACWPQGGAERRYAGVCHLDVDKLDKERIRAVRQYCTEKGVKISSLAYYPNTLDPDLEKRAANIAHLKKVIEASADLEIGMVTTFVGRDQAKTVEENLEIVSQVWPDIIQYAEQRKVRIAIENCPMLFDKGQWPGGQNLATTPAIWRKLFEMIPSQYFGLNYDPSHFIWQMVDYIQPIYEFKDRIFHVHCKDIKLYPERLKDVGTMAYPLEYMSPKLPGLGDVDWGAYISALLDIGYHGPVCVEVEDRAFEQSKQRVEESLILSKRHLDQFVI